LKQADEKLFCWFVYVRLSGKICLISDKTVNLKD